MSVFEALWHRLTFPISYMRHDSTESLVAPPGVVKPSPASSLIGRPARSPDLIRLPVETLSSVVAFAVADDVTTFVALSGSAKLLRAIACRQYFDEQRLITRSKGSSTTTVSLKDTHPLIVAGLLLTFDALKTRQDIVLEADVFWLIRLRKEFCAMLESCAVSSIRIVISLGHSQDYLTHDPALSTAFVAMLASSRSMSTIEIISKKPKGLGYDHPTVPQHCRQLSLADGVHARARQAMEGATTVHINNPRFCVPLLSQVYPFFLRGTSIVVLSLTCESTVKLVRALDVVDCPALEELWLTAQDALSIVLPLDFLERHANIQRCMLLNRPSGDMPSDEDPPKPQLFLPPITMACIFSNYSSIYFESTETLRDLIIRPVHASWSPHDEGYCHEVTSPCALLSTSQQDVQYPSGCCITIYLPSQILHHARYRRHRSLFVCRCTPGVSERILNILALQVVVDHLDIDVFQFLCEWLNWFPELRAVYIRTDSACGTPRNDWGPSASDLRALTTTCSRLAVIHWGPLFSTTATRGLELTSESRWVECQAPSSIVYTRL